MKVLMIHVGSPVVPDTTIDPSHLYERYAFESGEMKMFLKKDIVNADSQMLSLQQKGVEVVYGYLGARKNPFALLRVMKRIRRLANKEKVDLVHVLWGATSSLITVLASPVPVVISYCGSDLMGSYSPTGEKTKKGQVSRWLSKLSAYGARQIITKSEKLKQELPHSIRHKATSIPNGVNLSLFKVMDKTGARGKLGWKPEEQVILFFNGSGAFVKNQPLAEKVHRLVQRQFPQARLEVVAQVAHEELVDYYNAADLMLLTSFHEGSNNSIKEAMACNLPVVSVDCGDARERIGKMHQGKVVSSYQPEELAGAVVDILNNAQRANGRDFIDEVSMENVAGQVLQVYQKALKGK